MSRISREEVERVASLARLSLSEPELARVAVDLDHILAYVETLNELDTTGVAPTSHAIPLPTPMRADRAVEPIDPDLALSNAPQREGSAFVVPKVIEGEDGS
jgi:aspartyl-tRNA(Asn)/glutamyl-tRNA(Gln) amidotransferase subunit C